jgi:transposase-like protein
MSQDKHDLASLFYPKAHLEEHHFTAPEPIKCKWCGSVDIIKHGVQDGVQEYFCLKCRRQFTPIDAPYGMRSTVEQIGGAVSMYYDGMSLAKIAQHLDETYHNPVNRSTVYRWIIKYTTEAIKLFNPLKPVVSDTWIVDETVIKIEGGNIWFWDCIDEDTRFLIASHLSRSRTINDVITLMERAKARVNKAPHFILSDGLNAYIDGIERVFGADSHHIQMKGLTAEINTNLIERFHSTLKTRTKVLRDFKTPETATILLGGFLLDYNFFRPHMSLANKTPAEIAKAKAPVKNWTELVRKVGMIQ